MFITGWTFECRISIFKIYEPRSFVREAEETEHGDAFPMVLWGLRFSYSHLCPFILAQVLPAGLWLQRLDWPSRGSSY